MRKSVMAALLWAPLALWADEGTTMPDAQSATIPDAAPARDADWGWAFIGALEFGGDDFATVAFTDGSTQDVKTGQGGTLGLGVRYRPYADAVWGLRSTIGYKFVTTKASNADIGIDRMVWDLVGNYRFGENGWVGGGLVRHMGISFDGGGIIENVDFDDALGLRLELGWRWFALSYTKMDYTDEFGFDYDASAIGLVLTNAY